MNKWMDFVASFRIEAVEAEEKVWIDRPRTTEEEKAQSCARGLSCAINFELTFLREIL